MVNLFPYLVKRKSFRKYDPQLNITNDELSLIAEFMKTIKGLNPLIKTDFKIVRAAETTAKFGEYCLLFYSEDHPQKLVNAGFILEQIDLYMASINIGACWYGIARTKEKTYHGLKYVIMLAFGKVNSNEFRNFSADFNRKPLSDLWEGDFDPNIKDVVILAPSACNSQPWRFKSSHQRIELYRKQSIRTIMPLGIRSYFNMIDCGIVLAFLDISLSNYHYNYKIDLSSDFSTNEDLVLIASINTERQGD